MVGKEVSQKIKAMQSTLIPLLMYAPLKWKKEGERNGR